MGPYNLEIQVIIRIVIVHIVIRARLKKDPTAPLSRLVTRCIVTFNNTDEHQAVNGRQRFGEEPRLTFMCIRYWDFGSRCALRIRQTQVERCIHMCLRL